MKSLICLSLVCLAAIGAFGQNKANLSIEVTNIKEGGGLVQVALYNSKKTFMDTLAVFRSKSIPANNQSSVSLSFDNIPQGNYAIAVFLDKNENKKLDVNFVGIPKEQYGFSAESLPKFRAPKFEEVSFEIKNEDKKLSVKLK